MRLSSVECLDCGHYYPDTAKGFREHSIWPFHKVEQAKQDIKRLIWVEDDESLVPHTRIMLCHLVDDRLEELARDLLNHR